MIRSRCWACQSAAEVPENYTCFECCECGAVCWNQIPNARVTGRNVTLATRN